MADDAHATAGPSLFHIADRALNRPLIIHPDKAAIVMDVLAGRIGVSAPDLSALKPEANRFWGSHRRDDGSTSLVKAGGGVAVITIAGTLVNRGGWIGANSGLVSYEGIGAQLKDAASDPSVHTVILDLDTPGGEAGGITSVGNQIRELSRSKRVIALVNDTAASGGYWMASQASEVVVSETSIVGSIGVLVLHVNRAGELQQKGLDATFIHAGAHKVDGHSLGPLPSDVRADIQASVDALYGQFVTAVAAGRGNRLSADAARATEARVFMGQAAIDAGLADRIGTFESVLADVQRPGRSAPGTNKRNSLMSVETNTEITPEAHAAAVSAARAEGAKAERTRIATIMDGAEAKARPVAARQVALTTDMTADAAATFLAALPAEATASQSFDQRAALNSANGFGADNGAPQPGADAAAAESAQVDAAWGKALAKVNGKA